ncbi:MFS transporter [Lichenifustis flavocetrariae]|uniref:MFS transporter n=1 Tax=Lichenifustis flavocetrariae TaxID=2949735 RepID=A0AA42CQW3_9HYPH|nr:MFS transporter [Lichenifustis flavocetrariae]MCW6511840.1 MFS transporter [Lichenifustis flavocetrariae]
MIVNGEGRTGSLTSAYRLAWGVALIFYFLEYVVRAAPAVMLPELSTAFNVDTVSVSVIVGTYYYTYSVTSLVAGAALDRWGARTPVVIGLAMLGLGCLLFVVPVSPIGDTGRLLQGAGSAFAFTGAVFLATRGFSGSALATAVGFTQSFGMLGGSAGQLGVGPLIHGPLDWRGFWIVTALACFVVAVVLFITTPRDAGRPSHDAGRSNSILAPFKTVLGNPQSYLCGIIAGLLFVPTTVGDMVWGVLAFEKDRSFEYGRAISVVAMVPLGWAIGCPLLGWMADALGRRKFALTGGAIVMLAALLVIAFTPDLPVNYAAMLVVGIGSGAAMIPYTIIKEVNPAGVEGSAVGVINFVTFAVTAVIGPVFARFIGAGVGLNSDHIAQFREGALFWASCVAVALFLSLLLRETGRGRSGEPRSPLSLVNLGSAGQP